MSEDKQIEDDNDCYQFPKEEYAPSHTEEGSQSTEFKESESDSDSESESESDSDSDSTATSSSEQLLSDQNDTMATKVTSNWKLACEKFPLLQNKRIWMILGAVVILLIFFHFIHHSGVSLNNATEQQSKAAQVAKSSLNARQSMLLDNQSLHRQMSQLKEHEDSRLDNIEKLNDKISNLQSSLDSMNSEQATMTMALKKLTGYISKVDQQVQENKHKIFPQPESIKNKFVLKPVNYHIKAVIPGRVWLKGSDGTTVTVAVGKKLSNFYGKVLAIDVKKGNVLTTSGKIISYGEDDS